MVEILISVIDEADSADRVARRLVGDFREIDGIDAARLLRMPAAEGERGLIDVVGTLAVNVVTTGGADAMMALLGAVLPRQADRELVVKLPGGAEFSLRGAGVGDEQFARANEVLLTLIAGKPVDETP